MSLLSVVVYPQITEFLAEAKSLLLQKEAANGLPLGIALEIERNPHAMPDHFLAAAFEDGQMVLAGVQVGMRPIVLGSGTRPVAPATAAYFAHQLAQRRSMMGGVNAPESIAKPFAAAWSAYTDQPLIIEMRQKIMQLTTVVPPRSTLGEMRHGTHADTPLVVQWAQAFQEEALGVSVDMRDYAEQAIHNGTVFFWVVDDEVVSMARWQRPLQRGITLSLVYTPPDLRGNGYASACVAALSQHLLDDGWRFCTLFTDADNPTSNKIYQNVGYQTVSDQIQILFAEK